MNLFARQPLAAGLQPATAPVSSPLRQPPRCSPVNSSLSCRGTLSRVSVLRANSVRRVVPVHMSSALLVLRDRGFPQHTDIANPEHSSESTTPSQRGRV